MPRLERAGYEVDPIVAGPDAIPSLLVYADTPVVVAVYPPGHAFPDATLTPARDPDGGLVYANLTTGCSTGVAGGARGEIRTIHQVLGASGLCDDPATE